MHSASMSRKAHCSQTLERIIEASRLEFIASGPAAAKIDSIAARANLTRQSVYYYYKNKEEIFFDIVMREAKMLANQFETLDIQAAVPEIAIRELLFELLDNANRAPVLSAFMVNEVSFPGGDKKAKATFVKMMREIADRLQVLLDRGAEQGSLRPGVDAARFFSAACMVTSGARNSRLVLDMVCGVDVSDEEGILSWQEFAVDLLMRSISAGNGGS